MMLNRLIKLPKRQSFFLFGPRQTGKSTLIRTVFDDKVWRVDLLSTELFFKYSKDPSLFRREAEEMIRSGKITTIFLDEIQRVPLLLNEVQSLMGAFDCQFIMTGSSARRLKRGGANLLAGRAVERHLFPFVKEELGTAFNLEEVLRFGTLPAVWGKTEAEKKDILSAYTHIYLKEEIQNEGIVRNLGGFSKFLDLAAEEFGQMVSFSAVARECHLPVRTVQSYFEILEDTLIGFRLEPWRRSARKRLAGHPKFYFFDLGVTNAIGCHLSGEMDAMRRGRLFEQFIVLEVFRRLHYLASEARVFFWRTNHGAEVDLLIEKHGKIIAACEIKSQTSVSGADFTGLRSFLEENPEVPSFVVFRGTNPYRIDATEVLPWADFLDRLTGIL